MNTVTPAAWTLLFYQVRAVLLVFGAEALKDIGIGQ
jgi:hypothetical protein